MKESNKEIETRNDAEQADVKFQKLTPSDNLENIDIYEKALDFAINDPEIHNVAVTGPYGSGKTSVLKTYQKLHEKSSNNNKKQFMFVSLADFKNDKLKEFSDAENQESKELQIEGKILNQIIHQVDANQIPRTNFKLKQKVSPQKVRRLTVYIVTLFINLLYLLQFDNWTNHVNSLQNGVLKTTLWYSTTNGFFIGSLLTFFILIGLGIYKFIQRQIENPILKKIKVDTYEIELFEKHRNTSPFDKHLDEILYVFSESDYDVFIFEDIDRYDINKLFIRLREINILLNKSSEKSIKFIYLLKDEVFDSKDRTKFFDYLIPIVPVMDSSNSYEKMKGIFQEGGILDNFDSVFLKRLSLYIDDLRLLKNIYNEYLVYYAAIKEINPSNNKLLSLIAYKNIFPNDFNDLQYGDGYVYNLFAKKDELVEQKINEIDEEIFKHRELLEVLEKEYLQNVDELDALFWDVNLNYYANRKGKQSFSSQIDYVKAVKENPTNTYGGALELDSVFAKMNKNVDYQKRRKIVEKNNEESKNKKRLEIEDLEKNKNLLKNKKIKDLITAENAKSFFDYDINNVNNNKYFPLIKYLVRNGYIDESYQDYQTYFWDNSMTKEDNLFLRSITDERPLDYDYKLRSLNEINLNLEEKDFDNPAILNFDLLEYLVKENHPYLKKFIAELSETKNIEFTFKYIEKNNFEDAIIITLNNNWADFIHNMLQEPWLSHDSKQKYLLKTFETTEEEKLLKFNINRCMTDYLSSLEKVVSIEDVDLEVISNSFIKLDIQFDKIIWSEAEDALNDIIYRNNLYEVNGFMIKQILNSLGNNENDIRARNYSLIYEMNQEEPLKLYLENNFELYMKTNLEYFANDRIHDSEKAALCVINCEDIGNDLRSDYIDRVDVVIQKITDIESGFWEEIIKSNKLKLTGKNLLKYYVDYAGMIDPTTVKFINMSSDFIFDFQELIEEFGTEEVQDFCDKTLLEGDINDENYRKIIRHAEIVKDISTISHLNSRKLSMIIDFKRIDMNNENLLYFKNERTDLIHEFIKMSIEEFIEIAIEGSINDSVINELLDDVSVEVESKKQLYDLLKNKPIQIDLDYPEELQIYILKKWSPVLDVNMMVEKYDSYSDEVKNEMVDYAIENSEELLNGEIIIPKTLLLSLIESDEVTSMDKFNLLVPSIHFFNREETIKYLRKLDQNLVLEVFDGKWRKINKRDIPREALLYYVKKEWISSFDDDKQDEGYYRVNAKLKNS